MRKRLEAILAMRIAHAGIIDTAKWQIAVDKMRHAMVDAGAAGTGLHQHLAYIVLVAAPHVQRQWFWRRIDIGNDLIQIAVFDNRQHVSKNFFRQYLRSRRYLLEQRGRDI